MFYFSTLMRSSFWTRFSIFIFSRDHEYKNEKMQLKISTFEKKITNYKSWKKKSKIKFINVVNHWNVATIAIYMRGILSQHCLSCESFAKCIFFNSKYTQCWFRIEWDEKIVSTTMMRQTRRWDKSKQKWKFFSSTHPHQRRRVGVRWCWRDINPST